MPALEFVSIRPSTSTRVPTYGVHALGDAALIRPREEREADALRANADCADPASNQTVYQPKSVSRGVG